MRKPKNHPEQNECMKVKLDWRKGAQENAASYYGLAKDMAAKGHGALLALEETKRQILEAQAESEKAAQDARTAPAMKRKKEWYEKHRWFFTSGGKLVVAGRDARQNDLLVAKTMTSADLFFHADIQGAPATILVGGRTQGAHSGQTHDDLLPPDGVTMQEKLEAAQFAASHSSAWKVGAAAVDVYAVEKSQLSKAAQGGFVGSGGFAIKGEREWFRSTPLGLAIGMGDSVVTCLPAVHPGAEKAAVMLSPGSTEKGTAAKKIAAALKASPDEVLLALPSGRFSIRERK
jgi:predicted ribosome quality control (RQC) complex YloA/Tae2 family protein